MLHQRKSGVFGQKTFSLLIDNFDERTTMKLDSQTYYNVTPNKYIYFCHNHKPS